MPSSARTVPTQAGRAAGLLAGMRIRKKLIFLHTCFSLVLAGILGLALKPAVGEVVDQAEQHEAGLVLAMIMADHPHGGEPASEPVWARALGPSVRVRTGAPADLGLTVEDAERIRAASSDPAAAPLGLVNLDGVPMVVGFDAASSRFIGVSVQLQAARRAVVNLYILMTVALLAVYALVAAALEIFVLPQHVYRPIRTLLDADSALQEGRKSEEMIAEASIPADELGEIMRSRNRSVSALRRHESDLAAAMGQIEQVATDLKRKNHLLEMARQNLADAGRLASVGMMSAGLAHEMNTPLAVLKGLAEKQSGGAGGGGGRALSPAEAMLMLRVVGRLERLSESLLDFARVRPPSCAPTLLSPLIEEAWTLVRMDRGAADIELVNNIPLGLAAMCDADRIVQVFVNLLRNAVDAMEGGESTAHPQPPPRRITAAGDRSDRDGEAWASITIADTGPGLSAEVLSTLFEPFASTRLDANGTGLGLAVSEGIVREHGGVLLARNVSHGDDPAAARHGAVFEVVLPACEPEATPGRAAPSNGQMAASIHSAHPVPVSINRVSP